MTGGAWVWGAAYVLTGLGVVLLPPIRFTISAAVPSEYASRVTALVMDVPYRPPGVWHKMRVALLWGIMAGMWPVLLVMHLYDQARRK